LLLKYLTLVSLILLSLLVELDAFAVDDPTRVSISANKNNYEEGETILLTISVSQFDDHYNTLKTELRINGTLIAIDKKVISENGKYTVGFLAEGSFLDEEGIMTASVFLRKATDTTQFNFKPRPPQVLTPIIENPITVIENATNIAAIIRIAPVSKILGCEITNSCFVPHKVTIEKGSQVKWVNEGDTHTITGGTRNDGFSDAFDSGVITVDYILTFDESGIYPYYCTIHPWMQGTIIVETPINNSTKVDSEPLVSKPYVTSSVPKESITLSPSEVNVPVLSEVNVPELSKVTGLTSSQDKSPPNILGILIVIVFFVFIFLIIRKFKKTY